MITGIRAAVLCSQVRLVDDRAELIDVQDYRIFASSRPGIVTLDLFLQLEVDASPTAGQVLVEAEGYKEGFPLAFTTDRRLSAVLLSLIIPVLKAGPLAVTVTDLGRKPRSFTSRWTLDYAPDAQLADALPSEIVAEAKAAAALLREGLAGDGATRVQ